MEDVEEEDEDSQEARLRVCSSKEPSPEETEEASPPSSPLTSARVIKSEAVSWPSLVSPPPVMTIPPHVLSELMSSVESPVLVQTSSSAVISATQPPKHSQKQTVPIHLKSKERSHGASFRPIEPSVSIQSPSLSLKPLPLNRLSDPKHQKTTNIGTRISYSQQPSSDPLNVRLTQVPRIVLPQYPLPNVKKK